MTLKRYDTNQSGDPVPSYSGPFYLAEDVDRLIGSVLQWIKEHSEPFYTGDIEDMLSEAISSRRRKP